MLAHGTGALNIDGCRVATADDLNGGRYSDNKQGDDGNSYGRGINERSAADFVQPDGRWPANLIHDGSDEVLAAFPQAAGQKASAAMGDGGAFGKFDSRGPAGAPRDDTGSAARFFYCAKASRSDRNEGTEALPQKVGGMVSNTSGQHITRRDEGYEAKPQGNHHPTVKPTDLMRYLCRLVTPPGGVVLDPFMGSGSTGKAAMLEGFRFIGCELSEDYLAIARARIESAWESMQPKPEPEAPPAPQMDLFAAA